MEKSKVSRAISIVENSWMGLNYSINEIPVPIPIPISTPSNYKSSNYGSNNASITNGPHLNDLKKVFFEKLDKLISQAEKASIPIDLQMEYGRITDEINDCYKMISTELLLSSSSREAVEKVDEIIKSIQRDNYSLKLKEYSSILHVKLQVFVKFIETNISNSVYQSETGTFIGQNISNLDQLLLAIPFPSIVHMNRKNDVISYDNQVSIVKLFNYFRNQYECCLKSIKETIPFLMDKYTTFKSITNILIDYPFHYEEFSTLKVEKQKLRTRINVLEMEIQGSNEQIIMLTKKQTKLAQTEVDNLIREMKLKETEQISVRLKFKETVQRMNEIKFNLLKLKKAGFASEEITEILDVFTDLNIPEFPIEYFKRLEVISHGNHTIYMGEDHNNKEHVVKEYIIKDSKSLHKLEKELKLLSKLDHPNITSIEGISINSGFSSTTVQMIMPYYSNGHLKSFLASNSKLLRNESFWKRTCKQLLMAIQHLHSNNIIHCDIKPENIFVGTKQGDFYPIVLGDFDISMDNGSRTMNVYTSTVGGLKGTLDYIAPEITKGGSATFKSDMYSFGKAILNCLPSDTLSQFSLSQLIISCLLENPNSRPLAYQALTHRFFDHTDLETTIKAQNKSVLPGYWENFISVDSLQRYHTVDVTSDIIHIIQELLNVTCTNPGGGRDRKQKSPPYSKLQACSVLRIENPYIFNSYHARLNTMVSYNDLSTKLSVSSDIEENNKSTSLEEWLNNAKLNHSINEKYLWHGTDSKVVKIIAEHGFDERVASLEGLFGAGIYFAEDCAKSDQYCCADSKGEFCILLCRVVIGRKFKMVNSGMSKQRRPPAIENSNGRVYDSVIGKSNPTVDSYRELIVYDRYQCYPEYIIKYKRA